MAVAPVAVEIGPRNKRRLMTGTVVLTVLGASVAGLLVTRPPAIRARRRRLVPVSLRRRVRASSSA